MGSKKGRKLLNSAPTIRKVPPIVQRMSLANEHRIDLDLLEPNGISKVKTHEPEKSLPQKCGIFLLKCIQPVLPLVALLLYVVVGGFVFYLTEHQDADVVIWKKKNETAAEIKKSVASINGFISSSAFSMDSFVDNYTLRSKDYQKELLAELNDLLIRVKCGSSEQDNDWNLFAAMFYSGTLISTIGYGNIFPTHTRTKVTSMIYATLGIPLMLYVLADMGSRIGYLIWHCYTIAWIRMSHCCNFQRDEKSFAEFPLSIAISITIGWLGGCALIFQWSEQWGYLDSFYFCFQTLTTIGLGDIVPKRYEAQSSTFILVVIGLSLVSMCWNLVQAKLEAFVDELTVKIHGKEPDECSGGERDLKTFTGEDHPVLGRLLNINQMKRVHEEWQKKAAQRHQEIQTENPTSEQPMQTENDALDKEQQTLVTNVGAHQMVWAQNDKNPFKEYAVTVTNQDPFRETLANLRHKLDECQEIVDSK